MGGAYIYFGRSGDCLMVGPADGNLGGEIVQVFVTYNDYFKDPSEIEFTLEIYNGNIIATIDSVNYVDTCGEIKDLNSNTAYLWDEFEYDAYVSKDTWPHGSEGTNNVAYDIFVSWYEE